MPDWPELVQQYGPLVWKAVYRVVGNEADASDCFQETFLRALKYVCDHPVTNWAGLLHRIATQAALDRLRERTRSSQRHDSNTNLNMLAGPQGSPSEQLCSGELATRLRASVSALPTAQAEVFVLCQLHEFSYQDTAELLGIETNAVGVLLHRARRTLADLLKDNATHQARCANAQPE